MIFIIILHFQDSSPSIELVNAEEFTLPMLSLMRTALDLLLYKVLIQHLFLQPFCHIHTMLKNKQQIQNMTKRSNYRSTIK